MIIKFRESVLHQSMVYSRVSKLLTSMPLLLSCFINGQIEKYLVN